jgi:hypothetical protein
MYPEVGGSTLLRSICYGLPNCAMSNSRRQYSSSPAGFRYGPSLWSSVQSSCLLNADILWFLWGTNWIYICYVEESRPHLWSSGQSSWLQIQISGFDSHRYHIFWEVVGLERGPLSLVSTTEELLERKSSGSGLENRDYVCMDLSSLSRSTLYQQKLALTSPTSVGGLVGIVCSRTQTTEFSGISEMRN